MSEHVFVSAGQTSKERVRKLAATGLSGRAIAVRLGLAPSTVAYHLRTLDRPADPRFRRRYDWAEVQAFYDAGHSISACQTRFGFARATFNAARRRGDVVTRAQAMPIEQLLAGPRNRSHLKLRLLRAGLKRDECELCGITEWRGVPLSLQLHHVNGNGSDNRLENLQLLCPNCHSQTANWGRRNARRKGAA